MLNRLKKQNCEFNVGRFSALRSGLRLFAALAVIIAFSQFACFLKKGNVNVAEAPSLRLALLPFNAPDTNEFRWTAMAGPIVMAKMGSQIQGLELIPLWQTMPVAIQTAGNSRVFTPDSLISYATWLSAKWAVYGVFEPTKTGISMTVNFVPSKENAIPFMYIKKGSMDWVDVGAHEAYVQFLRYLIAGPVEPNKSKGEGLAPLRSLAEALDREYGWTREAEPGKAQEIVSSLLKTDDKLARFLFSPTLYPALAPK
jgi:hypothetical protein